MRVGVLALQGGVVEHESALASAARAAGLSCSVVQVRTPEQAQGLDGIVIPGGESTVLFELCKRAGLLGGLKKIPAIMGTCAGAIMLAKRVDGLAHGQGTLGLMDIGVSRNAYGRQAESFEAEISSEQFGRFNAVFIRAPRIKSIASSVRTLASLNGEVVACEQEDGRYLMATCFHPELTTAKFHGHFLKKAAERA